MIYFWPFLIALFSSFALTFFLLRFGKTFGLVAQPRKRDVHKNPVPRIGGLAIFLSFLLVSLTVFSIFKTKFHFSGPMIFGFDVHLLGIWLGGTFITLVMLYDDLFGLRAYQKLSAQIFATVIIIASGIGIDFISNPFGGQLNLNSIYIPLFSYQGVTYHFSLLSDLFTLIWLVGMMNIMNFIDGVDGLAGGQTVIASLTIFFLSISLAVSQPGTAMIAIIMAGAALGFLIWNFPPAKIFMGDSGSMFIGFVLGLLAIISGGKIATIALVLGFPIVDGLIVTIGRLYHHQNPLTTPDKTHLHHRLLMAGFSVRQSILLLYLISATFGIIALSTSGIGKVVGFAVLILAIVTLVILLSRHQAKKAEKSV